MPVGRRATRNHENNNPARVAHTLPYTYAPFVADMESNVGATHDGRQGAGGTHFQSRLIELLRHSKASWVPFGQPQVEE